jgi:transcriptional regulator with XRE-family HTH domain
MASNGTHIALARRLRRLREEHWDVRVTQRALAEALGVSEALISSWENQHNPVIPPHDRLVAYATFFASRRSIERSGSGLRPIAELGEDERAMREALLHELTSLRDEAVHADQAVPQSAGVLGGTWHFGDGAPIMIVCSELPPEQLKPDATPTHPKLEYGELYSFSSLDALFELHGHIRAANPRSDVRVVKNHDLVRDDYSAHLVVLGGIDWNPLTRRLQDEERLHVPVRQVSPSDDPVDAYFETASGKDPQRYGPMVLDGELLADVGHFFRAPNPFNRLRTLSICNGCYSLGTYGAVRALTDTRFRDGNEEFVRERFSESTSISILMRIDVFDRKAITPDWNESATRLHEWPE